MLFDWDRGNISHIARHGVTPRQCEAAMENAIVTVPGNQSYEPRWKTTGVAEGSRLDVIWTLRGDRVRVVTAYWKGKHG